MEASFRTVPSPGLILPDPRLLPCRSAIFAEMSNENDCGSLCRTLPASSPSSLFLHSHLTYPHSCPCSSTRGLSLFSSLLWISAKIALTGLSVTSETYMSIAVTRSPNKTARRPEEHSAGKHTARVVSCKLRTSWLRFRSMTRSLSLSLSLSPSCAVSEFLWSCSRGRRQSPFGQISRLLLLLRCRPRPTPTPKDKTEW